jgi:hypothetical protein
MDRKYADFKKFDFGASESWQTYYDNLYPKPPLNKVEKFKKKWYKQKVDPLFDVAYEPPKEGSQPNQ